MVYQRIHTDKIIDDVAFFGDRICYAYYVMKEDHDLQIKVQMFSGLMSYTLNPMAPAQDYESSVFKFIGAYSSALEVTARERREKSSTGKGDGVYYLCMFPHITSTYSVLVTEVPHNNPYKYLGDGFDEVGEI